MVSLSAPPEQRAIDLSQVKGQEDFVFDDRRYVCWIGGRGCAKSSSGTFKLMRYLAENEGAKAVVVAPTYPQLKSGTMQTVYEHLPPHWIRRKVDMAGTPECEVLPDGHQYSSRIYFRNAYNPDSFRSLELALVWIDEAPYCNPSASKILLACQRQKRPDGGHFPYQTVITGTPKGQNWVYTDFIAKGDTPSIGVYYGTPFDNPFLPPDYVEDLKRSYVEGSRFYDQEVMGRFVAFEGLVYPSFNQETHVKPAPDTFKRVYAGIDFGLTEASCILLVGETASGRRWVFKEYYQRRAGIEVLTIASRWREQYGVRRFFCDPRAPDEIRLLQAHGLPASKGNAHMETGVRMVTQLLAKDATDEPGLYISPECPNLIGQMLAYCHQTRGIGDDASFYDSIKTKQEDHAVDCLRYATLGAMGKQQGANISAIRFGR